MTTYIRQGDRRWRSDRLGAGASTIGGAGCLLCCVQEAARQLGTCADDDPRPLNAAGVDLGAFVASGAIVANLATCAGLRCGPRIAGDVAVMRAVIVQALRSGARVLLHVDHDSTKPGGDDEADHWVLAVALDTRGVVYADPSTGEAGALPTETLQAPSTWADRRVFAVRAVRVLSVAG
jgi:hypothetical protein